MKKRRKRGIKYYTRGDEQLKQNRSLVSFETRTKTRFPLSFVSVFSATRTWRTSRRMIRRNKLASLKGESSREGAIDDDDKIVEKSFLVLVLFSSSSLYY